MEERNKDVFIKSMSVVYEKAKDSKLSSSFLESVKSELDYISSFMSINQYEALIFSIITNMELEDGEAKFKYLTRYLDTTPTEAFFLVDYFKSLAKKNIIKYRKSNRYEFVSYRLTFNVTQQAYGYIFENLPISKDSETMPKDTLSFLEAVNNLIEDRSDEVPDEFEILCSEFNSLLNEFKGLEFIDKISSLNIVDAYDVITFCRICWKYINGDSYIELYKLSEELFESSLRKTRFIQSFISNSNILLKKKLIELNVNNYFGVNAEILLTDDSKQILEDHGINLNRKRSKKDNLIAPEEIVEKELIYNAGESKQIELLKKSLMEENFKKMQETLLSKGLASGITAILHGFPGTGKTETVYQIAKATGRSIVKVDISKTKSAWFGETKS